MYSKCTPASRPGVSANPWAIQSELIEQLQMEQAGLVAGRNASTLANARSVRRAGWRARKGRNDFMVTQGQGIGKIARRCARWDGSDADPGIDTRDEAAAPPREISSACSGRRRPRSGRARRWD